MQFSCNVHKIRAVKNKWASEVLCFTVQLFFFLDCAMLILLFPWQEIKLGTQSCMGIINPCWQRMHDNYKQKLCHSPWGKQLQGWQAMLNINMDHRTKDLVSDATATGWKARWWLCGWEKKKKKRDIGRVEKAQQSYQERTYIIESSQSKYWRYQSHYVHRSSQSVLMFHHSPPKTTDKSEWEYSGHAQIKKKQNKKHMLLIIQ